MPTQTGWLVASEIIVSLYNPAGAPPALRSSGVEIRRGDYADPASLRAAFAGADKLLLVSYAHTASRCTATRSRPHVRRGCRTSTTRASRSRSGRGAARGEGERRGGDGGASRDRGGPARTPSSGRGSTARLRLCRGGRMAQTGRTRTRPPCHAATEGLHGWIGGTWRRAWRRSWLQCVSARLAAIRRVVQC